MASRNAHAHRALGLKGKVWLGLSAVLLGGGGATAVAFAGTTHTPHDRAHSPVKPRLFHNSLAELPDTGASGGRGAKGHGPRSRGLTQRGTEPFNLLGVSWDAAQTKIGATVQVRTRSIASGTWSGWTRIETADSAPDPSSSEAAGARGATEPLWTGPSNGVEVRVVPGSGTRALPSGLRLDLVAAGNLTGSSGAPVDASAPEESASEESAPESAPESSGEPSAQSAARPDTRVVTLTDAQPAAAVVAAAAPSECTSVGTTAVVPARPVANAPQPTIVTREQWGADETLRDQTLPCYSIDGVKAVFVHHTADTNNYTCTTDPTDPTGSAARVQAEYAYHVISNGWRDLGYNFLVDKCGNVFEGRWGGADNGGGEWLPVFGAHTYGFNVASMGVAVLGTYTSTPAPDAVLSAIAKLANWKLGMNGIKADGTVPMLAGATQTSGTYKQYTTGTVYPFDAISGHRDGFNTECPGNALYPQLGTIRSYAAAGPAPVAVPAPVLTMTGATLSGTTRYTTGKVTLNWTEKWASGLFSRFEVLVDGQVVAKPAADVRSAALTLAAGSHTVAVRAVHLQGKTAASAAMTVVSDATKPVFSTAPAMQLRTGTVSTGAVPVTLTWKATDNKLLKSVALTSPAAKTFGPTVTSYATTAKSGVSTSWALKATDMAGNSATASAARTPAISQETAAAKTGTWTKRTNSSYLGGASYSSKAKNASLTWTFTGRSVAWVVSRASDSGQAYIYLDGKKVATYDLKSSKVLYRQAVWTKNWSTSATHKLKIVVVATSGRPTITTDGIVVLK
ncbi:N-acetylmuramoyl-L-alanine amidase [Peterkaempfera bronchialis]|uniref:N-acetylmuramoyl-L-alanine amidase n=1 Tax=Peterkaempfera bronchialis TaxID=2126346 RepID=UPI003C2CCA55